MAQPARILPFLRRPAPQDPERTELLESLAHTRLLLNQAYSGFNNASNGEIGRAHV